ncbi:MAG TPA: preprotein translocase subunit SecE [Dehalococcoidia bacterium]|jgi:preprotein translocase subunit SecE|nr:preprotein translocase subunit SecE [Dehalococcoidia bacterium]
MSRAIRRQQSSGTETSLKSPLGPRQPRQTRGAKPPTQQKRRFRPRLPGWIDDIISELKKVTWPTRDETMYLTMVVIVVAVLVGALLGGVDIFFSWLIDRLLLK